ncbi:hypothetical protein GCM10007320_17660 [Pseudorhodoferax aquiterrae]|uniref:Uncharacterized protein n=1 Tax=Pseudorhodoferax aquiterrae TaxID=747304 RepID=A0ABQ3FZP3_9BURK|nr:hypothetical protein [Pseudorhodoferax aquiterrae]GHC77830.1 hypothetical protein GCM10007320_17660 [Pseudorhodoferax aquiterrae]
MDSPLLQQESPWNTELLLPRITQDAGLTQMQIAAGGLSLLLSRLSPEFARSRFLPTRRVVQRLTRALDYRNPAKAHLVADDLAQALRECERALDPGTAMALKSLLALAQRREAEAAQHERADDYSLSDFMAEQQLSFGSGAETRPHALTAN